MTNLLNLLSSLPTPLVLMQVRLLPTHVQPTEDAIPGFVESAQDKDTTDVPATVIPAMLPPMRLLIRSPLLLKEN